MMITEYKGACNLHDLVMNQCLNEQELYNIWCDFTNSLTELWTKSACKTNGNYTNSPRSITDRYHRIYDSIKNKEINGIQLSNVLTEPITINGERFPSIQDAFNKISKIDISEYQVICHGDPQPSNIIVNNDNWYLIDWEWCGNHDWRMMFSHLFGWWITRCSILLKPSEIIRSTSGIEINYELAIPERFWTYLNKTIDLFYMLSFNEQSKQLDKNLEETCKFLSLLFFGELRFLHSWNRNDFAIPLIGEAIKILYSNRLEYKSLRHYQYTEYTEKREIGEIYV